MADASNTPDPSTTNPPPSSKRPTNRYGYPDTVADLPYSGEGPEFQALLKKAKAEVAARKQQEQQNPPPPK